MKKNITALILLGIMALSVWGCRSKETEDPDNSANAGTEVIEEEAQHGSSNKETDFSFTDLKTVDFLFASGAGGWSTTLTIYEDGSFSGEYHDSDMGSTSDEYPNGTRYQSDFDGQFAQPVKVNEYTYSMQIRELNYAEEVGKEEIIDGVLYQYSGAYGLDGAEEILIYLPGAPINELPPGFRNWVDPNLSKLTETELPFYGLYNEAQQQGFSGYDIVESVKQSVERTEDWAVSLEESIQNDLLTQLEYNEKTQKVYEIWDAALNEVWGVLKRTLDKEAMDALTVEEREWIALKEQTVAEAGADYEGGSMQSMVRNQKAAEMTKARVYQLLEMLE